VQVVRPVVAEAERKVETVEPLRHEQRKVPPPEIAVVEPRFVLHFGVGHPHHAAHRVRRPLDDRAGRTQHNLRVLAERHGVGELGQRIDEAAHIAAGCEQDVAPAEPARCQRERLRLRRRADGGIVYHCGSRTNRDDAKIGGPCFVQPVAYAHGEPALNERQTELFRRPARGRGRGDRIAWIAHDGNAPAGVATRGICRSGLRADA